MRRAPSHAGRIRLPSHAGNLRAPERMIFALIFGLMAAFVAVVTVAAAKARSEAGLTTPAEVAGVPMSTGSAVSTSHRRQLNAVLAAALQSDVSSHPGTLAVAVLNVATGAKAMYAPQARFRAGRVAKADVLVTLLLEHQNNGTQLSTTTAALISRMMIDGNMAATVRLWRLAGGTAGIQAANHVLGITHTTVGRSWRLTSTTVTDQLRLLADLTAVNSPLDAASRAYALGLLNRAGVVSRRGVPPAAGAGRGVLDCVGIVRHGGAELLIAVLVKDNVYAAGVARAEAAAATAVRVATASGS